MSDKKHPLPTAGGSYSRDPATGKLTQISGGTLPALTAQEVADGWVDEYHADGTHKKRYQVKPAAEEAAPAPAPSKK